MKARILLTGCHGRLGQHLLRGLLPHFSVLGTGVDEHSFVAHPDFRYACVGGVGRRDYRPLFQDFCPDYVLNAAAWTDVDAAETMRDACWKVNVDLVRTLQECCRSRNIWLGQPSTDYVFAAEGPHECDDRPESVGVYAQSKLAAENLLRGSGQPVGIFRTAVLFGKGYKLKKDFCSWVAEELLKEKVIRVVSDQISNACWAMDLAQIMQTAMVRRRTGVYHAVSPEIVSRYSLAQQIAGLLGADERLVQPALTVDLGQLAPRPLKGGLLTQRSERALGMSFRSLSEALKAWYEDRPETWSLN